MPTGVVTEMPRQPIVIVRVDALQGADRVAFETVSYEGHQDGSDASGNFAEGAGEAVQEILFQVFFGISMPLGNPFDELAQDGFGKKWVKASEEELGVAKALKEAVRIRPGQQPVN